MNERAAKVVNLLKKQSVKTDTSNEFAAEIGVSGVGFLAGEPEYFSRFMALTGVDISDIAEISQSEAFLGAVLQFILADDSLLLSFCQAHDQQPEAVNKAYFKLAGPDGSS